MDNIYRLRRSSTKLLVVVAQLGPRVVVVAHKPPQVEARRLLGEHSSQHKDRNSRQRNPNYHANLDPNQAHRQQDANHHNRRRQQKHSKRRYQPALALLRTLKLKPK
jgi:G3E family GTPase